MVQTSRPRFWSSCECLDIAYLHMSEVLIVRCAGALCDSQSVYLTVLYEELGGGST